MPTIHAEISSISKQEGNRFVMLHFLFFREKCLLLRTATYLVDEEIGRAYSVERVSEEEYAAQFLLYDGNRELPVLKIEASEHMQQLAENAAEGDKGAAKSLNDWFTDAYFTAFAKFMDRTQTQP